MLGHIEPVRLSNETAGVPAVERDGSGSFRLNSVGLEKDSGIAFQPFSGKREAAGEWIAFDGGQGQHAIAVQLAPRRGAEESNRLRCGPITVVEFGELPALHLKSSAFPRGIDGSGDRLTVLELDEQRPITPAGFGWSAPLLAARARILSPAMKTVGQIDRSGDLPRLAGSRLLAVDVECEAVVRGEPELGVHHACIGR